MDEGVKYILEMDCYFNKSYLELTEEEIAEFLVWRRLDSNISLLQKLDHYYIKKGKERKIFKQFIYKNQTHKPQQKVIQQAVDVKIKNLENFINNLELKRYSWKTIKLYKSALQQTAIHFENSSGLALHLVKNQDLYNFFIHLTKNRKLSVSSIRIYRFALEMYFNQILNLRYDFSFMKGIKKRKSLPKTLTKNEIKTIIRSIINLKHRLMISLLYSAGLRISELVSLKVRDVNLDNLTIHIKEAKGKKDRITIFSESLKEQLSEFLNNKNGYEYVFTSNFNKEKNQPLTVRTIQSVFKAALNRSGVKKDVSCHDLRHSFATHLLENGIDVRYIKELLGHKSLTTTSIYTHCTNPAMRNIKSPL
jgi:integrase/recombinase XerD